MKLFSKQKFFPNLFFNIVRAVLQWRGVASLTRTKMLSEELSSILLETFFFQKSFKSSLSGTHICTYELALYHVNKGGIITTKISACIRKVYPPPPKQKHKMKNTSSLISCHHKLRLFLLFIRPVVCSNSEPIL